MRTRRVAVASIVLGVLAAITIAGGVWTITQAVKSSAYDSAYAEITAVETEGEGDSLLVRRVLVKYTAGGETVENARYIGDLSRCRVGYSMKVYYKIDGDKSYVYSKSSDIGFALIMLCAGGAWLIIATVAVVILKRGMYFSY